MIPRPRMLLIPRARSGAAADFGTRAPLIARQRHPARRVRRARRLLRAAARVLGVALVLAAVGVVGLVTVGWVRTTPLLAVRTVELQGLRRLSEEAVRSTAGIEPGTSLLTLDVPAIEDRLEAVPGVRSARVVRHLPGRVVLQVAEREPYALINVSAGGGAAGDAGGLLWVDDEGFLVGPGDRPGAPALPILSGVEEAATGVDHPPSDRLRAGLALLRAVQRVGGQVAARISEVDLASADGPVLYLVDGAEVRVGGAAWEERLARLDGVLGELDSRGERVASVDLRFRDLVVLKPRPVAPGGSEGRAGAGARRRPTTAGTGALANPTERRGP